MSTVDINKNRERWLKKKFEKLVKEARTADGQWLQEELARQEERHRLKQAGLLDQPTFFDNFVPSNIWHRARP